MTLDTTNRQTNLFDDVSAFCDETLAKDSIAFLHQRARIFFSDEAISDLFATDCRRSAPPSVVAVVMVFQRLEGLTRTQ